MINGEPDLPGPDVHMLIDAVALHHADERLDDLARVTLAPLSSGERAAWQAWRRARNGRLGALHRA